MLFPYSITDIMQRNPPPCQVFYSERLTFERTGIFMSDENERENSQLTPTGNFTVLLDKVFKNIFNATKKDVTCRRVWEDRQRGINTMVNLELLKGDLNQLDKFVFCAALSEYRAGNKTFTIRRLFQKMGGSHELTDEMKKLLIESVERLACTRAEINMTAVNDNFHYCDKKEVIFKNYLLPCKSVEVKINGRTVDGAFQISDVPPLMEATELKKQFSDQPTALLAVPKLHNSELVLKLKFFLLERITAIIGSHKKHKPHRVGKTKDGKPIYKRAKRLRKIITFEDIFVQCDLSDATGRQRQQARETIAKILDHFKACKLISEWHFEKKNGAFYSVHFT